SVIRMSHREIDQRQRDHAANSLDQRLGPARTLEHEPHDWYETDENRDAGEQAQLELLRRCLEQRRVAIGQRLPRKRSKEDGDKVAKRRKDEKARIALGPLEVTGHAEPDEESDIHAGVIPEERTFAARIFWSETLRQHHVDARDVQAAAGEE